MDATTELNRLSGLQQLQAIFAGKTDYAGKRTSPLAFGGDARFTPMPEN